MDPGTGHLVSNLSEIPEALRERYRPVPFHLQADAERALNGQRETVVNLNQRSNLAAWAAKERKKNRTRAKIAKRSRARNRK